MNILLDQQTAQLLVLIHDSPALSVEATTVITYEINTGPWGDANRLRLAGALGEACAKYNAATTTKSRDNQNCEGLVWYFSQTDWDVFTNGDLAIPAKIKVIGHRMFRLGMGCPSTTLELFYCTIASSRIASIVMCAMDGGQLRAIGRTIRETHKALSGFSTPAAAQKSSISRSLRTRSERNSMGNKAR